MNKKNTILYVDDEPINIMLFEANFKNHYHVVTAESGLKGLENLQLNPEISIVVSDMKMPEMNGIQFIREAKKKHTKIKYFILSGYELTEEIIDALNNKLILKYFKKPFNMKEIEDSINEAFQVE